MSVGSKTGAPFPKGLRGQRSNDLRPATNDCPRRRRRRRPRSGELTLYWDELTAFSLEPLRSGVSFVSPARCQPSNSVLAVTFGRYETQRHAAQPETTRWNLTQQAFSTFRESAKARSIRHSPGALFHRAIRAARAPLFLAQRMLFWFDIPR